MICKECKDAGLKSTVSVGTSMTTLMYCAPYYDEEGKYHHHDWNDTITEYTCSNGHTFSVKSEKSCHSCDWKGERS